jgi:hypothetical protein
MAGGRELKKKEIVSDRAGVIEWMAD